MTLKRPVLAVIILAAGLAIRFLPSHVLGKLGLTGDLILLAVVIVLYTITLRMIQSRNRRNP